MPDPTALGEFEQLVLLAILQLEDDANVMAIRQRLEQATGRKVTRGALYATLDRLEVKGCVTWEVESITPARGGIPRRRFRVTKPGVAALRRAYGAVQALARGLEHVLGRAGRAR
jgi:DNA-binding PadR family transcriptional regulator